MSFSMTIYVMKLSVLECSFPTRGEAYLDQAEVGEGGKGWYPNLEESEALRR